MFCSVGVPNAVAAESASIVTHELPSAAVYYPVTQTADSNRTFKATNDGGSEMEGVRKVCPAAQRAASIGSLSLGRTLVGREAPRRNALVHSRCSPCARTHKSDRRNHPNPILRYIYFWPKHIFFFFFFFGWAILLLRDMFAELSRSFFILVSCMLPQPVSTTQHTHWPPFGNAHRVRRITFVYMELCSCDMRTRS